MSCHFGIDIFLQDIKDIVLGSVLFVLGLPLLINYIWKCRLSKHSFSVLYRIENLVFFFTISSIILWLLGPIFDIISPNMHFDGSWGAWTYKEKSVPGYYGLLFLTQIEDGTFLVMKYGVILVYLQKDRCLIYGCVLRFQ